MSFRSPPVRHQAPSVRHRAPSIRHQAPSVRPPFATKLPQLAAGCDSASVTATAAPDRRTPAAVPLGAQQRPPAGQAPPGAPRAGPRRPRRPPPPPPGERRASERGRRAAHDAAARVARSPMTLARWLRQSYAGPRGGQAAHPGPIPARGGRAARGRRTRLPARRPRAVAELREAGEHVSRPAARAGGRAALGRRTCLPARRPRPSGTTTKSARSAHRAVSAA